MKKLRIGIRLFQLLFVFLFVGCAPSVNLNMDEAEGLNNIQHELESVVDSGFRITYVALTGEKGSSRLEFANLSAFDTSQMLKVSVSYDLSEDTIHRETVARKIVLQFIDTLDMSAILTYVAQCKRLIPQGYEYSHIRNIVFERGDRKSFEIQVTVPDEEKKARNRVVRRKWFTKHVTNYVRGKPRGTRAVRDFYYLMNFRVLNGVVVAI